MLLRHSPRNHCLTSSSVSFVRFSLIIVPLMMEQKLCYFAEESSELKLQVTALVFDHKLVQRGPKLEQTSLVQVSFRSRQLQNVYVPLGNIVVQTRLIPLEVKTFYTRKYFHRRTAPRPAFKLPRRSMNKHGHNSIPIVRLQLDRIC